VDDCHDMSWKPKSEPKFVATLAAFQSSVREKGHALNPTCVHQTRASGTCARAWRNSNVSAPKTNDDTSVSCDGATNRIPVNRNYESPWLGQGGATKPP
jgi:hypothetical protein